MEPKKLQGLQLQDHPVVVAFALLVCATYFVLSKSLRDGRNKRLPPAIPGLPILGNLLQMGEKKPYRLFTSWAQKYGPIYTIKTGCDIMAVISSSEVAKEAMITKYSSIATRKMSSALLTLTGQKTMVAMSDYGERYRLFRKLVVTHLLGSNPQNANRVLRELTTYKMLDELYADLKGEEGQVNVRECIEHALFPLSMYQTFGRDPDTLFVEEWDQNISRYEIYHILVLDPLKAVIEIDWRDYFPTLKWVPNKCVEESVKNVEKRRTIVIRNLIKEQRQLLEHKKEPNCYLDRLLKETCINEKEIEMLTWESVIESADTILVTTEWAMFELAKDPIRQEQLYEEIKAVAGDKIVKEDHLSKLQYLAAIYQETLRVYSPVALLPPRHVDQDVQLGGYDIPKGWQVLINQYGINHDPTIWPSPDIWNPDRMLATKGIDLGIKDHRVLPFGTGKRICAGMLQAMYVVQMYIATFVQHFKWSLTKEESAEDNSYFLTSHKLYPLVAIATPRVPKRIDA